MDGAKSTSTVCVRSRAEPEHVNLTVPISSVPLSPPKAKELRAHNAPELTPKVSKPNAVEEVEKTVDP